MGELIIEGDETIEFLEGESAESIQVVAAESVERAGFVTILTTWLKDFFSSLQSRF